MNLKPLLIVLGEPNSVFSEILFKYYKYKIKNFKKPIIIIGSKKLLKKQMLSLGYFFKFNLVEVKDLKNKKLSNKSINIININYSFNKTFDKISNKSEKYIKNSFKIALDILKNKNAAGLINGPISKKHLLRNKYFGITEYLSNKVGLKNNGVMLIYNNHLSVSPLTTHIPLKMVSKNISKTKIINNALEINRFYKNYLKKKPRIAVLGLNPHCESIDQYNEDSKIVLPAINNLKNKKIKIYGPFSADTFFLKKNILKFDVVIGMYHDQVLTPIKTLYNFDAINITLGLPFLRISPDHGPNHSMLGKNISDPTSLYKSINFFKNIK